MLQRRIGRRTCALVTAAAVLGYGEALAAQSACPIDPARARAVSVHFAGLLVAVDSAALAAMGLPPRVRSIEPVTDRAECAAALAAYNRIRYPLPTDTAEHLRRALVLRVDSALYLVVDDRPVGQVAILSREWKWLTALSVPDPTASRR